MKKTVTILCLMFSLAATVYAQDCPVGASSVRSAKTSSVSMRLPARFQDNLHLATLIQQADAASGLCMMIQKVGRASEYLYSADGELTSVLGQHWDGADWANEFLDTYTYDENGFVASVLLQEFDGAGWVNEVFIVVTFDAEGRLLSFTEQEWQEGAWVNSYRQTSTYENGFEVMILIEGWDGAAWVGNFQIIYTLGEGDLLTEFITQTFEEEMWVGITLNELEYDELDRESVNTTSFYDDETDMWGAFNRILTTYPDDFTVVETEQSAIDEMGATNWVDFNRVTTTYGDLDKVTEVLYEINFGDWTNSSRTLYAYNDEGLELESIDQDWSGTAFVNNYGYFSTYDDDGDILTILEQEDDGPGKNAGGVAWANVFLQSFNYGETSTAAENEVPLRTAVLQVFPSPASGRINIGVELEGPAFFKVDVYDLLGRHVVNLAEEHAAGAQQLHWEPAALPAGMYFIRMQINEETTSRSVFLTR